MENLSLLKNVHDGIHHPEGLISMVTGSYEYYHYGCDGVDDRGWGCGYRTLQTLCSWVRHKQIAEGKTTEAVPSLLEIQKALVNMQDKPKNFVASRQWIGSVEVGLIVDFLYDVPCKITHINSGLNLEDHVTSLAHHFETIGSPVMMGGDSDNSSKGIIGVCQGMDQSYLLILDPHFYGNADSRQTLVDTEMLRWRPLDSFVKNSFYNLCLPQYKAS